MNTIFLIAVTLALPIVLSVGVIWLAMWGVSLLHWKLSFGVGVAAIAYLGFEAVRTIRGCSSEPVFEPPPPGTDSVGRFIHACDGPGGLISFGFAYVVVPVCVLLVGLGLLGLWRRGTRRA